MVKNTPASTGATDLIPRLGRSPGEGTGNLLQCSCLGNPMTEEPGALGAVLILGGVETAGGALPLPFPSI